MLLLPDSDGDVAAEVADRLALVRDLPRCYSSVDEEYDAAALLEAASAFFAEQQSARRAPLAGRGCGRALAARRCADAVRGVGAVLHGARRGGDGARASSRPRARSSRGIAET